jgi:hypothetical protein
MGFDKNNDGPIIQPAKKETKINISMVIAVLIFFVLGGAAMIWMRYQHG